MRDSGAAKSGRCHTRVHNARRHATSTPPARLYDWRRARPPQRASPHGEGLSGYYVPLLLHQAGLLQHDTLAQCGNASTGSQPVREPGATARWFQSQGYTWRSSGARTRSQGRLINTASPQQNVSIALAVRAPGHERILPRGQLAGSAARML